MDGFESMGLPMGFGKKKVVKKATLSTSKVEATKRDVGPAAPPPSTAFPPQSGKPESYPSVGDDNAEAGPSSTSGNGARKRARDEFEAEEQGSAASTDRGGDGGPAGVPGGAGGIVADNDDDSDDEDDDDDDLGEPDADPFPVSHEIILKDHNKAITALSVDSSGARLATGSHDYDSKIWDFGGMDGRLRPFKSFEPCGTYPLHDVAFSPDNKLLLIIAANMRPKLYTREGEDGVEFNKGDPYIRDMRHTKGHVAELTSGAWHPKSSTEFITASHDSTIRIWNTEDRTKQKQVIVVPSKERGARTKVTTCAWSPDGKMIGGASEDGGFHLWSTTSNFVRPSLTKAEAHVKYTETSGITFSRDGRQVATRGGDDTVKLWDLRSLKEAVYTATDLPNIYGETNIVFSPDEKHLLTGLAVRKEEGKKGEVIVLDREGLIENRRIPIGQGSVVRVLWHSRINQIFATTSLGACHILYSPRASIHGALLPLSKMERTAPRDISYTVNSTPVIYTPHALPMFKDEDYRQSKKKKEKERLDPVKSHKPQEMLKGAGRGGRIGASATQHLVQSMFRNTTRDEDPREALLKYADAAASDPQYTSAWTKNQPKPVFSEPIPEKGKEQKLPESEEDE